MFYKHCCVENVIYHCHFIPRSQTEDEVINPFFIYAFCESL